MYSTVVLLSGTPIIFKGGQILLLLFTAIFITCHSFLM